MSNSLFLAVGFFAGSLAGIAVMALAAAGELRGRPAKVHHRTREGGRA
jgi:hypothetical protein